jgi:hypothetical protein
MSSSLPLKVTTPGANRYKGPRPIPVFNLFLGSSFSVLYSSVGKDAFLCYLSAPVKLIQMAWA